MTTALQTVACYTSCSIW